MASFCVIYLVFCAPRIILILMALLDSAERDSTCQNGAWSLEFTTGATVSCPNVNQLLLRSLGELEYDSTFRLIFTKPSSSECGHAGEPWLVELPW
jgi:hypothetical protein